MDLLNVNKLKKALNDYIKVRTTLLKIELKEHVSDLLAKLIAYSIVLLLAAIVLLFISLGIAFLINKSLDSSYLGFMIVATFYLILLIGVISLLHSGKLKSVIEDAMLNEEIEEDEAA